MGDRVFNDIDGILLSDQCCGSIEINRERGEFLAFNGENVFQFEDHRPVTCVGSAMVGKRFYQLFSAFGSELPFVLDKYIARRPGPKHSGRSRHAQWMIVGVGCRIDVRIDFGRQAHAEANRIVGSNTCSCRNFLTVNPEVQQSDIVDFKPFTSLISNLNGCDVHLQIIDANRMVQVVGLNRSNRTILPVPLEVEI